MGEFFNREKEEVIEKKISFLLFIFICSFFFGRVSWLIELLVGLFLVRLKTAMHDALISSLCT